MYPLLLLVVVAVKVSGVATSRAETRSVFNDSNFTIVSLRCRRISARA